MEIHDQVSHPNRRSCAELGVCQARVPACQGCDHENQWRPTQTRWGRVVRVWKRWNSVLWVAVAILFVAGAVMSGLSLADKVASSISQDKGYVQYLQDKLIILIPVSYTHLTLPTKPMMCRSRWSPYH